MPRWTGTIVAAVLTTASWLRRPGQRRRPEPRCAPAADPAAPTSVLAWGDDYGRRARQRHQGRPQRRPGPVHLPPGTHIRSVSAGCGFALALTSRGQVLGWGTNRDGRLGLGADRRARATPVPVPVPAHSPVIAVRACCHHALALTAAGQAWAWGRNLQGQIGTGHATGAPVRPPGARPAARRDPVTAIGAGFDTSTALTAAASLDLGRQRVRPARQRHARAAPVPRYPGSGPPAGRRPRRVPRHRHLDRLRGDPLRPGLGLGPGHVPRARRRIQAAGFSDRPVHVRLPPAPGREPGRRVLLRAGQDHHRVGAGLGRQQLGRARHARP